MQLAKLFISDWSLLCNLCIYFQQVGDLAAGIVNAIQDPSSKGKIYECYG